MEQLEIRYGKGKRAGHDYLTGGSVLRFDFKGFRIFVTLHEGKSANERFWKARSSFTESNVEEILQANSDGKEWEKISFLTHRRKDGFAFATVELSGDKQEERVITVETSAFRKIAQQMGEQLRDRKLVF